MNFRSHVNNIVSGSENFTIMVKGLRRWKVPDTHKKSNFMFMNIILIDQKGCFSIKVSFFFSVYVTVRS